jgi:hypothetical protein
MVPYVLKSSANTRVMPAGSVVGIAKPEGFGDGVGLPDWLRSMNRTSKPVRVMVVLWIEWPGSLNVSVIGSFERETTINFVAVARPHTLTLFVVTSYRVSTPALKLSFSDFMTG